MGIVIKWSDIPDMTCELKEGSKEKIGQWKSGPRETVSIVLALKA